MKIAFIGASGHFRYALEEAKKNEIVGIAPGVPGEDLSKLKKAFQDRGIEAKEYKTPRDLLPLGDVAVVNTRFDQNAAVTMECLKQNVFVFSEKPLAITLESLEEVKKANENSRAFVCAMFGIRFSPWFLTLKKALPAIGTVRLVTAQKSYKIGTRSDYYKERKTFGGLIPWVAIHGIDWILQILGNDPVKKIAAYQNRDCNFGYGTMETAALCQMQTESGAIASVSADYFRPKGAFTHGDDRLRAVGARGVLEARGGRVFLIDETSEKELPLEKEQDVFSLFLRRVQGENTGVTPEESFLATEIALRAQAAADREERL